MRRALFILPLFLCSCFSNRAALNPYSYAPQQQNKFWKPGGKDKEKIEGLDENTDPLSLAEIVDISLRNNPNTRLTWADARVAAAQYGGSQSADLPTLTSTYAWSRFRNVLTAADGYGGSVAEVYYFSQWGPQLQLSYTLLDFGQARAASQAAKELLYNAGYIHNRQIQTVIQQVTADYYSYIYQQELLKAYQQDLKTAETTYEAAKVGFDAGIKNLSDLLEAKTKLLQSQIQLVGQNQVLVVSLATLLTDMGLKANQKIPIKDNPAVPPIEEMLASSGDILEIALAQRADLLAAEARVKSEEANIVAVRQQFYPTVTYNLNFGETSYSKIGGDGYDFTTTFSLNFPIFSGFSTLNSLRAAHAKREKAEAELVQTQLQVIKDVTTSHSSVQQTFEALKFSSELLKVSEEQYQVALALYKAGTGNILEVVSAQSSLANARAHCASANNDWFTALINLSYAAGSLQTPEGKIL
jgi:outer membrane protein TolC